METARPSRPPHAPPGLRPAPRDDAGPHPPGPGDIQALHEAHGRITTEIEKVIVGQKHVIDLLLISLLAGGHSILIGVPGLAKTLLVSTLARLLSLSFKRIQFTPDLMPSDITGTDVLQEDRSTGARSFRFFKGPIFANMILADELNRTPPKTQAALLEAMQERQVTVGEATHELPQPFLVIATQNPIEQEGTYNLPEAQLDRFLFAIKVGYPSEAEELEVMKLTTPPRSIPLDKVMGTEEILAFQALVPQVPAADHVHRFALALIRSSRPEEPSAPRYVKDCLSWGAGTRAAQSLIHGAKARALLHGRFHVTTGDVEAVALPVLAHRLVTNFNAEAEGITPAAIVEKLLADVPREGARS
jgi:MoxR-like ATPase